MDNTNDYAPRICIDISDRELQLILDSLGILGIHYKNTSLFNKEKEISLLYNKMTRIKFRRNK